MLPARPAPRQPSRHRRRGLTDVIAYSLAQPDGRLLGTVYISPDAAAVQPRNVPDCGKS